MTAVSTTIESGDLTARIEHSGAEIASDVGEVASSAKIKGEYANPVLTTAKDLAFTSYELNVLVGRLRF